MVFCCGFFQNLILKRFGGQGFYRVFQLSFWLQHILFLTTHWRTQAIIAAVLLVGYWLAMTLIPTPGEGKVMLEPGVNLAAWIDSKLLPGYMWEKTWDPEGILSTFPAIATGITGMLAGHLIISDLKQERKVIYLFCVWIFCFSNRIFMELHFPG